MKAADVKEPGYYWYWDCGQWVVAECEMGYFHMGYFHYFGGTCEPVGPGARDFDVVGPIQPPAMTPLDGDKS